MTQGVPEHLCYHADCATQDKSMKKHIPPKPGTGTFSHLRAPPAAAHTAHQPDGSHSAIQPLARYTHIATWYHCRGAPLQEQHRALHNPHDGELEHTTDLADPCTLCSMAAPLLHTTVDVHTRMCHSALAVDRRQQMLDNYQHNRSHKQLTPPTRNHYLAKSTVN